jgi:hypothetical protein
MPDNDLVTFGTTVEFEAALTPLCEERESTKGHAVKVVRLNEK